MRFGTKLVAVLMAFTLIAASPGGGPEVDLTLDGVVNDTAFVTGTWVQPADDGNGPIDSVIVSYGKTSADTSSFDGVAFNDVIVAGAFGFTQNHQVKVGSLNQLPGVAVYVRYCVTEQRGGLNSFGAVCDNVLVFVAGPIQPPPANSLAGVLDSLISG